MDLQRPIADQVSTGAQNAVSSIRQNIGNTLGEFGKDASLAMNSVGSAITSTVAPTESTESILDLNSLFAKAAFVVLVVLGFFAILRLSLSLIGYYMQPASNPYLIKGLLNGGSAVVLSQNPANANAVPIPRSNDVGKGAEFTWSVWLFVNQPLPAAASSAASGGTGVEWNPVFIKGEGVYDGRTGMNACNGPGVYLATSDTGTCSVRFAMDTIGHTAPDKIDIPNIPQQKWVHLAFRLQNTVLDVYVNGVVATRTVLSSAPKQNYYDVHVCPNGGFVGSLSDLRYYSSALSVFGVNNVVAFGPSTVATNLSTDAKAVGGNYSYLSRLWYGGDGR